MTIVEKIVLVEHTPAQMFELVDQVEDYPKFLPWCGGTQLHLRSETLTTATVHINYHGVKSHFSTDNTKRFPHHMQMCLRDGPMKHLDGSWQFSPLGDSACKIEFRLHYEFSSRMLEKVLGPVFSHIANSFVEAFVKRAKQLYG